MSEDFDSYHRNLSTHARETLLRDLGAFLESRPEIIYAYVFGSFVSGLPYQDVDVALYLHGKAQEDAGTQGDKYAELLGSSFKEVFDVVIINRAPNSFKFSIFSEGRLLFCRDDTLLSMSIEMCSLDMVANEDISRESLMEIVL